MPFYAALRMLKVSLSKCSLSTRFTHMSLSNTYPRRRAFITGAASGLGRAFCDLLAAEGWTLGMADVDASALSAAASSIEEQGGHAVPVDLDVTDAGSFHEAARYFVDEAGGVDLVVNNAGIAAGGMFDRTSLDDWRAVINVNLMGVVHGCQAFVPYLKEQRSGHIINIASLAAIAAAPGMSAYNVSKAGVKALSETLYGELKPHNIYVSVVMPSFFKTNLADTMRGDDFSRKMTERFMDRAEATAHDIAQHALDEAGNGTIHVIYPTWMTRLVWYWKRLMPTTYIKSLPQRTREMTSRAQKDAERGEEEPSKVSTDAS